MGLKKSDKSYKLSAYIIIFALFLITISVSVGIRKGIASYGDTAYNEYVDEKLNTFDSILHGAIDLGEFGLTNSSNKLQQEIKENLDMDRLEDCLLANKRYPEFDRLLRDNLQKNVYTRYSGVDQNRNSIFVMVNGNIIASYTHDDSIFSTSIYLGAFETNAEEMVQNGFYNIELSLNAIDMIKNQYKGLIIWQQDAPTLDIPKYSRMTIETLHDILLEYGLDGLESFEILIPEYITEYGNMFGDTDIPGSNTERDNKLILVQKLNIVDYIEYHYPEFATVFDSDQLIDEYDRLTMMINIFIIIECLAMIAYACMFMVYYNHKITVDELETKIQELKTVEESINQNQDIQDDE